nr:hypothetical protein [uncultured Rhodopila sp.]
MRDFAVTPKTIQRLRSIQRLIGLGGSKADYADIVDMGAALLIAEYKLSKLPSYEWRRQSLSIAAVAHGRSPRSRQISVNNTWLPILREAHGPGERDVGMMIEAGVFLLHNACVDAYGQPTPFCKAAFGYHDKPAIITGL